MSFRAFLLSCAAWLALIHAQPAMAGAEPAASCLSQPSRLQELQELQQTRLTSARPATQAIPREIHDVLTKLVRAARLPAGLQLRLVAVDAGVNASVDHAGTILLSTKLWTGEHRLGTAEIAAVLAHEIAHAEALDPLARLCDTVALVGNDQLSFRAATRAMHQAIWSGDSSLAIRMMQQNHVREHRADLRGAQLLAAAGFATEAMGRMLVRVAGGRGEPSGSHPALEQRLEVLGYAPQ